MLSSSSVVGLTGGGGGTNVIIVVSSSNIHVIKLVMAADTGDGGKGLTADGGDE